MINHDFHLCLETVANKLRVDIIKALQKKPMNVNELTNTIGVERTRVSHSLQMLRDCRFVHMKKCGKERVYALNTQSILHAAEEGNKGLFALMEEHKQKNCGTCIKLHTVQATGV